MPLIQSKNDLPILRFGRRSIKKFRPEISKVLSDKFGIADNYNEEISTNAMAIAFEWYVEKFKEIIKNETSLQFYQSVFMFHEWSIEIRNQFLHQSPADGMEADDFANYRRVLKLILEQACDLELKNQEKLDKKFKQRAQPIMEDLLYLGDFMYALSNIISDQKMIGYCRDLKFTDDGLYYFDFLHHYEFLIQLMNEEHPSHMEHAITSPDALHEFEIALERSFGVTYNHVIGIIQMLHEYTKKAGGKAVLHDQRNFTHNLSELSGCSIETAETVLLG